MKPLAWLLSALLFLQPLQAAAAPSYLPTVNRTAFGSALFSAALTANLTLTVGSGSFTLTRATSGSYVATGGNITQATSGNGRFTYEPRGLEARGIVIGSAVTNKIRQSEVFGTTWTKITSNTVTSNTDVAPDGATTADTITSAAAQVNAIMRETNTVTAATAYAFNVFAKAGNNKLSGVRLSNLFNNVSSYGGYAGAHLGTGLPYWYAGTSGIVLDNRTIEYANGWHRIQQKGTSEGTPNNLQDIAIQHHLMRNGSSIGNFIAGRTHVIWGAQWSANGFTPMYFPSVAADVTQNADKLSIATSGNIPVSSNDFTVALEWSPTDWAMGTVFLWGTYVDASNYTALLHDGTNLICRKRIGGTNHDSTIAVTYEAWVKYRVACAFSSTQGTRVALQGVVGIPDVTLTAAQIGTTMEIGSDGNGANQANSAIANVSIYSGAAGAKALVGWNSTAEYLRTTIFSGSLAVPAKFLGIHIHKWPQGSPLSTAPTYGYGTIRSHDYSPAASVNVFWCNIEANANGVYDWTYLDAWVSAHQALGHDMIFTFYCTPTGYASSGSGQAGPEGYLGEGAYPTSLTPVTNFITALYTRYNTMGGGYSGATPGLIKYLEVWNEPDFGGTPSASAWFWGTVNQFATLTKAASQAAKAVDATVKVIGVAGATLDNSDTLTSTNMYKSLTGSDGAGNTTKDFIDLISIHPYASYLVRDKNWTLLAADVLDEYVDEIAVAAGLTTGYPRIAGEFGYDSSNSAALMAMTPTQMSAWVQTIAVGYVLLNYQSVNFYDHDGVFIGNPMNQPIISAGLNYINTSLAGKTLTNVQLMVAGTPGAAPNRIKVTTTSGVFYITLDTDN